MRYNEVYGNIHIVIPMLTIVVVLSANCYIITELMAYIEDLLKILSWFTLYK